MIHASKGKVDYDAMTARVRRSFPQSKWNRKHWAWYRHQIQKGRFREMFSDEEHHNLQAFQGDHRGSPHAEEAVKRVGDSILKDVRSAMEAASHNDSGFQFRLNRWIYSRLQQDEIKTKRPIKKQLWDSGIRSCQKCGEPFKSLKGVEIHRTDSQAYSLSNTMLLCRSCHEKTAS
jgi:hypothetical protein